MEKNSVVRLVRRTIRTLKSILGKFLFPKNAARSRDSISDHSLFGLKLGFPRATAVSVLGMGLFLSWVSMGKGALIADWNFNGQTTGTAPTPIAADHGSGSLDLSHIFSSSDAVIGGTSSGTSVNKVAGDTNGKDLQFASSGTGGANENGKFLIFSLSTSGYQGLVLTYAAEQTGNAFTAQNWSYSTDGGANYTSFASINPSAGSYATATVDFSSI